MLKDIIRYLSIFVKSKKGQGMVEYALIIAVIAIAVLVALTPMGTAIRSAFDFISNTINGIVSPSGS